MIDLHMHSCYSDGSQSPTELVCEAKQLGLTAIALTDHDTVEGIPEFMEAGKKYGVITVPGVEISIDTQLPNHGHMHMLGLFVDVEGSHLKRTLDFLREQRNLRAEKIIQKLNTLGIPITLEELLEEAGEGSIGRPHVAKILVRKGVVASIQEAFDVYLAKGKPAYMDKVKLGEVDAIQMIHEAGGLAILAHPHLMNYPTFEQARQRILQLRDIGLDGFEIYYSAMPEDYSSGLVALAQEYGFATSGGSDYHGMNKENIRMGTGTGTLAVPNEIYFELKKFWETRTTVKSVPGK